MTKQLWNRKIRVNDLPDDNEIDFCLNRIGSSDDVSGLSKFHSITLPVLVFCRRLKPWHGACTIGWISFVTFQCVYSHNVKFNEDPWCSNEYDGLHGWYSYLCFGNTGGFLITWVIFLSRFQQAKHSRLGNLDRYLAYLNVVTIGLISSVLMLTSGWGKFCTDYFGVATPAVIWGEWFAAGPIIFVVMLTTITEKPQMDRVDWLLVASFTMTILFGFLLVFTTNLVVAVIYLTLSYLFNVPLFFLPLLMKSSNRSGDYTRVTYSNPERYNEQRMRTLACWISLTMPLFGLTYVLAATGVISLEATAALFQVFSMAIKGLYGAILVNLEADAVVLSQGTLQQEIAANISRRSYLKYVFHEVRNPLNSLVLGIDILEQGNTPRDAAERETLVIMRSASEFMGATLNDVLSMQKIEEGKMELDKRNFHLPDAVSKVFSAFRGAAVGKDLTLQLTVAPGFPPLVLGDRFKIEHMVGNLLSNAIKFSPRGAVVEVALSETSHSGLRGSDGLMSDVMIDVKDHGPGISAEDQLKLFGSFVQINAGELQQGAGSGLGLSLCKQMVELHGGQLTVISAQGTGSTFRATIPFRIDVESINKSVHSTSNHGTANVNGFQASLGPSLGRSLIALVVDDAESNSKMLKMLLSKIGVSSFTAENGQVAVDMVVQDKDLFDIVFMDNQMPVMTGLAATRVLREAGFGNLIVGVTGNVLEDDVREFMAVGADIVLGKPLSLATLQALVRFMGAEGFISRPGSTLIDKGNRFEWMESA